jgi:glycosyltransferase involved in cell wall biosynthesis
MVMARSLLFYTHALVGGGAERVFARMASGFAARGDHVDFVVDFEATESLAALSGDVRLRVLPPGHARATRALASILAREKPDASLSAISVSNLKHTIAAVMAGRRERAILTYHGFFESEPERLSRIGYRLTPLISRLTHATVGVSEALSADLRARFHVPADRSRTIHNPAAPEPFPAPVDAAALLARAPRILALGRLVDDKDFSTLLRAFAKVQRSDAQLIILGEGPNRGALEGEARALGVGDRVSLPGFSTDVASTLGSVRCLAISSRRESFSLACVEALAHGLPVVATKCGGPQEILNAPSFGAIVPVGDAEALARALDRWLGEPGDPAARQARGADFKLDRALGHYDELIRSAMAQAGSRR